MQVTDELRVLVEAEVTRAIENFKKLSAGVEDSEKKTASLGEALDLLSKKSLIISGVLGGAGIAAVKFAGENEKLKLSLKNMLGSAEEAAAVFEDWRRLGSSPGLNAEEVFSLGRAMVNMGHDTQYATSTMQMLGNVAAGTSASFGEISSSFERARAMGNLTSRDLVRLQQQGIPIVRQLAQVLGTSEENIKRLAAEGKIGFADLERAFRSMTAPGGQFAGMMDELSGTVLEKFSSATDDAKQALASFGEMLLPLATDLLSGASSILNGITNMDDGTKRFVLGMGGVVAVSGPAIAAIKGISAAMKLAMANPYMLAIGGVIAAAGVVAGIINKQAHAYEDLNTEIRKTKTEADSLLGSYSKGNDAKILNQQTTAELIKLYPKLAGEITAYTTTVDGAAQAVRRLAQEETRSAARRQIESLRRQVEAADEAARAFERYRQGAARNIEIAERMGDAFSIRQYEDAIEVYRDRWNNEVERAETARRRINAELARIGETLGADFEIIPLVNLNGLTEAARAVLPAMLPDVVTEEAKRSWQEWFGEITKIDHSLFGNNGARAAQLYISEFERTLNAQTAITDALGVQLDIAGILRSRQTDVQNALVELFAIDPDQINRPFSLVQPEIQKLIEEYRRLGEEAKTLEDSLTITDTLERLSREVQNLGKDQHDLALAAMAAANATEEQMLQAEELIKTLREARETVVDLGDEFERVFSFAEVLSQKVSDRLLVIFPELEKQAAQALGNIAAQLSTISFDSLLGGLNTLGEALGRGDTAANSLRQALADMSQQILNQLPGMFLQAGLQLIAQGQWPLGLGFVAAAGSSAIISGYVRGRINNEREAAANAHGNAFDSNGIVPYASGAAFTNQIVSKPTYFRYGGKFGVMGEAGPESIMPLRRMSNGDLGVAAAGAGANVTVKIINNAAADIRHEEYTDSEGNKQIDVIVGQALNNHITSGKADRAMSRYGIRPVGV